MTLHNRFVWESDDLVVVRGPEVTKGSAHTEWMNECVPTLMGYAKDQEQAVAACLNMWRQAWEENHPDGADDPGPSPKEGDPDSPLAEAAKEKMLARARKLFSRAQPRTLYAHRKLLNRDELIAWAKAQGFATTLDDEMHVTVAFSKQPFDWEKVSPDSEPVTVVGGKRSVEELGDEGAIVLRFTSPQLQTDWQRYIDAGASWDYPGYKPHVTITYEGGDVDLASITPYRGELRFGPEVMAEIKEDLDIKERLFNESEHPRDEHGRWTDGGGSDDAPAPAPAREGTKADMEARYGKPSANWQATASGLNTKEEQRLEADGNFIRRNQDPSAYSTALKVENDVPYYSEYIKVDADHSYWRNFITTPKGIAEANLMMVFGADKPTLEIQTLLSKDRGSGRAALEMLTKAADEHGVYLQLDPVPLEPHGDGIKMPKDKLEAFYAKFGFVQEGERDEGGEGTITMVRPPQAAAPAPTDDSMLFVSEMPNQAKLDKWNDVLNARSEELATAGEAGNAEDNQISRMQTALAKYSQEDEASLKAEAAGLNAVYDSEMKLQAAAFSYVAQQAGTGVNVATISSFGALNHAAGVKALNQVVNKFASKVDSIESTVWQDDLETIAIFEAAGYKQRPDGSPSGGSVTMVKGDLPGGGVTASRVKMRLAAEGMAKKLDFDPAKIVYTDEDKDFVLGGVSYKYAGSYQRGEPDIKLYTRQITPENVKGITAHEIGHRKFEMLRNQLKIQTEMMMQDKGPPPDPNHRYWWGKKGGTDAMMTPTGEMRPPYDEKYPIVHEWAQIQNMRPSLEQDDGITPYSKSYWTEWEKGEMATDTAYHETMAEMSRNLGVMGKHSAVTGKGWRRLYDLQEKVWAKTEDWQRDMSMNAPIKAIFMIDGILWEVR